MAGECTPASPASTPSGHNGTAGLAPNLEHRARATGTEAGFLAEAGVRLESVSSLLSALALGHTRADIGDVLPPVIAVLDDAARFVDLAGEE